MTTLGDVGKMVLERGADVAVAGGTLTVFAGWGAYEWVAARTNYYDAPYICGAAALGVPIVIAGGAYAFRGGVRRLAGVSLAMLRDESDDAGPDEPDEPEESETPISDPVGMLADSLHLLLVGFSGGGKTTLMHALAMRLVRGGHTVIVLDPDAAPGLWRGCTVVGAGDNWPQMQQVIKKLHSEVVYRRQLRARGQRDFEDIYVLVDEYADVHDNCEQARPFVEDLLRRGRKLGIHLFLGVQDRLVRTMGFEGQGELRRNFTYVVDVKKDQASGQRIWTLEQNNDRSSAVDVLAPRLPDPERLVTPVNIDGERAGVTERLDLEPERNQVIPACAAAIQATVPVPGTAVTPQNTPVPGKNGAKTAGNAGNAGNGNGNAFSAGTERERPLSAAKVAAWMKKRFAEHPDFADPPPSLDEDKVVAIAVLSHAGLYQNEIMRALYSSAGGRYREYVKLVESHLDVIQAAWQRRQQRGR